MGNFDELGSTNELSEQGRAGGHIGEAAVTNEAVDQAWDPKLHGARVELRLPPRWLRQSRRQLCVPVGWVVLAGLRRRGLPMRLLGACGRLRA